jgi:hypothetical protein
LREVAAYHRTLAGGAAIENPRSTARLETRSPSETELARLAATAETANDHRALESYFASLATRYDRESADHAAYAKTWRGLTKVGSAQTQAASHDKVSAGLRESAKEARTAASMHKDQASKSK